MKKEKETYQLPSGYFEDFQDRLQVQIELKGLVGTHSNSGFKVPDDYFNTLSQKLAHIPENQEESSPTVIRLKTKKWQAIGIAAAIALVFGLLTRNTITTTESLEIEELTAYLETESTFLYTQDILSLLSEEDLNSIVLNDEVQSEEDILNYLDSYSNTYDFTLE